ncbi:MAG: MFS transporter, partial [Chloroflexi bacterium]|nr:MFS transporter [Chloroflexota bacterium]
GWTAYGASPAGWRLLRGDLAINLAMFHLTVVTALTLVLAALAPGFISRELNLSPNDTYLVFGPAGLGILSGTYLLAKLSQRVRLLSLINTGLTAFGVGLILLALVPAVERGLSGGVLQAGLANFRTTLVLVGVIAAVMGVGLAFVNVTAQTILQERAPEAMRGRVFAIQLMFGSLASVLPLAFAGQLADWLGVLPVLALVGLAVLGAAWFSRWQTRRVRAAVARPTAAERQWPPHQPALPSGNGLTAEPVREPERPPRAV